MIFYIELGLKLDKVLFQNPTHRELGLKPGIFVLILSLKCDKSIPECFFGEK